MTKMRNGDAEREREAWRERRVQGGETSKIVVIDYTNHRGERRNRRVTPKHLAFTSNEWHATEQWLLVARDEDICEDRTFALSQIHRWEEAS
jgi:predicted DNA-binding transcriptional regulator YafY